MNNSIAKVPKIVSKEADSLDKCVELVKKIFEKLTEFKTGMKTVSKFYTDIDYVMIKEANKICPKL